MHIIVVGTGKLAIELLGLLQVDPGCQLTPWHHRDPAAGPAIVLHAGSGRELPAVTAFCAGTHSTLIELSTGTDVEAAPPVFPVIVCPNTNILMLKVMDMLEKSGHLFRNHTVTLTESHQASKQSVPGTAVHMARSLGLQDSDVHSVRNPAQQQTELQIPSEHLARHAYHRIVVQDGSCSLQLETRVYGESPYAAGVAQIVAAVRAHALENRVYSIMEFINRGWL